MNTTLEEKERFITARYDRIFKTILIDENDHSMMKAILSEILKKKVKIIKYILPEIKVRNKKERVKTIDVLVSADGEMINLELNLNNGLATKVRNFHYFASFYSQNVLRGKEYDTVTKYIQINLSFNMSSQKSLIDKYRIMSEENNEIYLDQIEIWTVNMDKLVNLWYSNDELAEEYKHVIMLDIDNKTDLDRLGKGDKIVSAYKEKLEKINTDAKFVWDLTPEEEEEIMANTRATIARNEGALNEKIEIAKKLIAKNMDIDFIRETTELSKDEIEKLIEEKNPSVQ